MHLQQMGCCAFNEIKLLGTSRSAPEAMKEFCQQALGTGFAKVKLGAFYIFTAVVKTRARGDLAASKGYGANFAKLIEDEGLGEVVITMARTNRKNVPGHTIQGWVWAPNDKNLRAWYARNQ